MPREKGHKGYWITIIYGHHSKISILSGESLSQDYSLLRTFTAAAALSPRTYWELEPEDRLERFYAPGYPVDQWWNQWGLNPQPPACRAGALPVELWPHNYQSRVTTLLSPTASLPFAPVRGMIGLLWLCGTPGGIRTHIRPASLAQRICRSATRVYFIFLSQLFLYILYRKFSKKSKFKWSEWEELNLHRLVPGQERNRYATPGF